MVVPTTEQNPKNFSGNNTITVFENKSNKLHNIEKGVAKYCPPTGYAILLNKGEVFNSATAF